MKRKYIFLSIVMMVCFVFSVQANVISTNLNVVGFATTGAGSASTGTTRNVVFTDGTNTVTIALNLRSSLDASESGVLGATANNGLYNDSNVPNERPRFWDSKGDKDENALFTATYVSSSAGVDASSIAFRIDGVVVFGGQFINTSNEVLWKSDALSVTSTNFTYQKWRAKYQLLDDQFFTIGESGTYNGTVEFNTTKDRSYYFRDIDVAGHSGFDLSVQFDLGSSPSSEYFIASIVCSNGVIEVVSTNLVTGTTYELVRTKSLFGAFTNVIESLLATNAVGVLKDQSPPDGAVFYKLQ